MSNQRQSHRAPWAYRFCIWFFSLLLTFLLVWLLDFVVEDIGGMKGPDYKFIEGAFVPSELEPRLERLQKQSSEIQTEVNNQREIQEILKASTENSQQTMTQLLAMYKLSLEKNVTPTETEQRALADSEAQFLDNQKRFQAANQEIARLSEQQRDVQQQLGDLREQMEQLREPARKEFERVRRHHLLWTAALQLAVVAPLLVIATVLVTRKRSTAYAPVVYAAFAATLWTTGRIIHEKFPSEVFKYIAVCTAIGIVLAIIFHLVRTVTAPRPEVRLRQYREAYDRRMCPVCAFPIQRGWARYLLRARRGAGGVLPLPADAADEEKPYVCPACGSRLFDACASCGKVRHTLLPYCEHCGVAAPVGEV